MTEISDFVCPNCKSRYKLVRVRSEPGLPSRLILCRVCKEPLTPTDGECALKYFLIEAAKRNGFDLQMKPAAKHGADRDSDFRRIASIIVIAQAAPKIATNNRSPCDAARPQPSAASAESITSSRPRGSIYGILSSRFILKVP